MPTVAESRGAGSTTYSEGSGPFCTFCPCNPAWKGEQHYPPSINYSKRPTATALRRGEWNNYGRDIPGLAGPIVAS